MLVQDPYKKNVYKFVDSSKVVHTEGSLCNSRSVFKTLNNYSSCQNLFRAYETEVCTKGPKSKVQQMVKPGEKRAKSSGKPAARVGQGLVAKHGLDFNEGVVYTHGGIGVKKGTDGQRVSSIGSVGLEKRGNRQIH